MLLFIGHKKAGEGAHLNRVNVAPSLNYTGGVLGVQIFEQDLLIHHQIQLPSAGHNSA